MAPRDDFIFEADVDTARMDDPLASVKATIDGGMLRVTVAGDTQEVVLPEDAFADAASAKLARRKLVVRVPRRDPNGPAMQEKRLFNPDRHPVQLDISLSPELLHRVQAARKVAMPHEAEKTPAQTSAGEFSHLLVGGVPGHVKMPDVNMGSSIVTSMPVMTSKDGVLDTVSQGETVVRVPGIAEVHHLTGLADKPGGQLPGPEELAARLRDTAVHDQPPPGATVLAGTKAAENEAAFDEAALKPATGLAGAPAGDEEQPGGGGGVSHGDKVMADSTRGKVGPELHELRAADFYVGAESSVEPISSMKTPGAPLCDLCQCAPCQCGMMRHTGGGGNTAYEMTQPELKRGGKPAIHSPHREITGSNTHAAHDYRSHAKQVPEDHLRIGNKLAAYDGNVPGGTGEWTEPRFADPPAPTPHGATHTGGRELPMPGGPVTGGQKTTFTTLG